MKTTTTAQETVTPQKIIDEIITWDDPLNIQRNLRKMLDAFLLYHDDFADGEKESVYFTFRLLSDVLDKMEQLNPRNKNNVMLTTQEKAELDARRSGLRLLCPEVRLGGFHEEAQGSGTGKLIIPYLYKYKSIL